MRPLALVSVMAVLAIGWFAGCGGSAQGPTQQGKAHTKQSRGFTIGTRDPDPGFLLTVGPAHRKPGESACTHVRVIAGKAEKAIDIVAHCFGANRQGLVSFVAKRALSNRHRPGPFPELLRYQLIPNVTKDGSTRRVGRCELSDRYLGCKARVHGRSTIVERIWVRRSDRCKHVVLVIRFTSSPCGKHVCHGYLGMGELFHGKPEGCVGSSA